MNTHLRGQTIRKWHSVCPTPASPPAPQSCSRQQMTATLLCGIRRTITVTQPTRGCGSSRRADSAEHLHLIDTTPHAGFLILRLRSYAAWKVNVNGLDRCPRRAPAIYGSLPHRDDGLMAVPVPQGPVQVDVDWTTTGDVVMGRLLSLMSLGCITVLCLIERKLAARGVKAEPRVSWKRNAR